MPRNIGPAPIPEIRVSDFVLDASTQLHHPPGPVLLGQQDAHAFLYQGVHGRQWSGVPHAYRCPPTGKQVFGWQHLPEQVVGGSEQHPRGGTKLHGTRVAFCLRVEDSRSYLRQARWIHLVAFPLEDVARQGGRSRAGIPYCFGPHWHQCYSRPHA